MKKPVVLVLFGGVSTEHEVSRISATSVLENIDKDKYDILTAGITFDGRWLLYSGPRELIVSGDWENSGLTFPAVLSPDRSHRGLLFFRDGKWDILNVDIVFPVLHGRFGEDGTLQGLLDMSGIPYVGCGTFSSAACMDKDIAKRLFVQAGIPTAKWITLRRGCDISAAEKDIKEKLGYPVFVKPANGGSSVGINKAADFSSLCKALDEAFKFDKKAVVEESITGAEVECAVMGNENINASVNIGEIVPLRELYDYEGKYIDGSTDLYIPARIPDAQVRLIRRTAELAYRALECTGLARVDFFALPDGTIRLNEINTLPGFTPISMYPKLFISQGMSYAEIIDSLIALSLERAENEWAALK